MKLLKKKDYTGTVRKIVSDDKAEVLGIVGTFEDLMALGIKERNIKMRVVVNAEIEKALLKKGYNWNNMVIRDVWGYTYKFDIILDGKYVGQYDAKKRAFFE